MSAILNHTDNSTTGIYDRNYFDQEKKEAMTSWAQRIYEMLGTTQL